MPGRGPDVVVAVPECAQTCGLVRMLLRDLARRDGVTLAVKQITWGMDPDPDEPA